MESTTYIGRNANHRREYMKLYMRMKRHGPNEELINKIENLKKQYQEKKSTEILDKEKHMSKKQIKKKGYYKEYVERNGRFKLNFLGNKSRAKKRGHFHNFTFEDWAEKLLETKGICPICGDYAGEEKLSMDHIVPTTRATKGTIYTINDVRPICCECNRIKWTNTDEELLVRLRKFVAFLERKDE